MELIYIIGMVCVVYLSTNIDNLLCLIGFFSNKQIQTKDIFAGWFVGSLIIICLSFILAYLGTTLISDKYIGILGILPVLIGLKGLYQLYTLHKNHQKTQNEHDRSDQSHQSKSHVVTGAAVTLANGGDNISAYAPLFLLTRSPQSLIVALFSFLLMTATFSMFGYFLVRKNKYIGQTICHYGSFILPFVLVFLGFSILYQSFWK